MSSLEKRAWLMLWSMCPVFLAYFTVQYAFPNLLPDFKARLICLAIVAGAHAVIYLTGWLVMKRQEAGQSLLEDERDHAIDARATRAAYFILISGMILVGVVMPFDSSGWKITNGALLFIVLSEAVRYALIVIGYRRPRLAH